MIKNNNFTLDSICGYNWVRTSPPISFYDYTLYIYYIESIQFNWEGHKWH
jgi:hypothetical protein